MSSVVTASMSDLKEILECLATYDMNFPFFYKFIDGPHLQNVQGAPLAGIQFIA